MAGRRRLTPSYFDCPHFASNHRARSRLGRDDGGCLVGEREREREREKGDKQEWRRLRHLSQRSISAAKRGCPRSESEFRTVVAVFVQLPLVLASFYSPDVHVAKTKLSLPQNSPGVERERGRERERERRANQHRGKERRSRDCNFRPSLPPSFLRWRRPEWGGQAHFLMFSSASPNCSAFLRSRQENTPQQQRHLESLSDTVAEHCRARFSGIVCRRVHIHISIGEFIRHRRPRPSVRFLILIPLHKSLGGGGGGRCQSGSLCRAAAGRASGEQEGGEAGTERHL